MSMTTPLPILSPTSQPMRRESRLWLTPRGVAILMGIWLLVRWALAAITQIVPDEAYYWVWSRHPALSYFDHPPMIAYLIRFGTSVFGDTSIGVRWPGTLLALGTVLILWRAAAKLIGDEKVAVFVPVSLLLGPVVNVLGAIMTPDTPACFFQAAALAVVLDIFSARALFPSPDTPGEGKGGGLQRGENFDAIEPPPQPSPGVPEEGERCAAKRWIAFGLLMGFALLSKYTSGLFGAAVLAAMLCSSDGRQQLRTPWPWLAGILAFTLFTPVIIWNAQHNWASFAFQLGHGVANSMSPLSGELGYLGGQCIVCTPILFILGMVVLVHFWRRRISTQTRILLFAATIPLVFFGYSALHRRVEANWPIFAYLPLSILIAQYLAENWSRQRVVWAEVAIKVALIATIVIHLPILVWAISPRLGTSQWDEMFGWPQLAQRVQELRDDSPVIAVDYHLASELSFYLPGHPDIPVIWGEQRPTAFDYIFPRPDLAAYPRVVLVRRMMPPNDIPQPDWRFVPYFRHFDYVTVESVQQGRLLRKTLITVNTR